MALFHFLLFLNGSCCSLILSSLFLDCLFLFGSFFLLFFHRLLDRFLLNRLFSLWLFRRGCFFRLRLLFFFLDLFLRLCCLLWLLLLDLGRSFNWGFS